MALFKLLVGVSFLSSYLIFVTISASDGIDPSAPIAKKNCPTRCGSVAVPYPFGIGEGCYLDTWFEVVCTENGTVPLLNRTGQAVVEISTTPRTVKVMNPITFSRCQGLAPGKDGKQIPNMEGSPFAYSRRNVFTSVACGAVAFVNSSERTVGGCLTICNDGNVAAGNESCNGVSCCQTALPLSLQAFNVSFVDVDGAALHISQQTSECRYAFVAEKELSRSWENVTKMVNMVEVPAVLEWELYHSAAEVFGEAVETDTPSSSAKIEYFFDNATAKQVGYINASCKVVNATESSLSFRAARLECSCPPGFGGNPYVLRGCQDIDECKMPNLQTGGLMCTGERLSCTNLVGNYTCEPWIPPGPDRPWFIGGILVGFVALFLLGGAIWWSCKAIKKKRKNQRKQRFFKLNGGLLLQQQLSSGEINMDKIKLFSSKDLDKATDRFNKTRILGEGGQGTVYKGMLADGKIVAVKKSKIMDGDKVNEFINEVVILSQIVHRNVVKLLGCCLETEVPLLVYEFIPNGTLSQYLHDECDDQLPLTWEMRLRIATETSGALAYLHSSASVPIYHRDIKSANILLDAKHRAKIADFGTSRSVAIDQTHLTTMVYGTFGYLDPEYFQSNQFTDKSDVYSFGVVLAELLTGQKALLSNSEKGSSLAACFKISMEENRLFDMVDGRVMKEGERETIMAFANLVKRCLNLNGKRRPSMKEVASVLEDIQKSVVKSSNTQQNLEIDEGVRVAETWDLDSPSTWSCSYDENGSSSGVVPLLSSTSQ